MQQKYILTYVKMIEKKQKENDCSIIVQVHSPTYYY